MPSFIPLSSSSPVLLVRANMSISADAMSIIFADEIMQMSEIHRQFV